MIGVGNAYSSIAYQQLIEGMSDITEKYPWEFLFLRFG